MGQTDNGEVSSRTWFSGIFNLSFCVLGAVQSVGSVRHVPCPRCGAQVAWIGENRFRPFCSERCKLIDLGDWATEKYRVPAAEDKDEPKIDDSDLEKPK